MRPGLGEPVSGEFPSNRTATTGRRREHQSPRHTSRHRMHRGAGLLPGQFQRHRASRRGHLGNHSVSVRKQRGTAARSVECSVEPAPGPDPLRPHQRRHLGGPSRLADGGSGHPLLPAGTSGPPADPARPEPEPEIVGHRKRRGGLPRRRAQPALVAPVPTGVGGHGGRSRGCPVPLSGSPRLPHRQPDCLKHLQHTR